MKIQFEEGEVLTIGRMGINIEVIQKEIEGATGMKFGPRQLVSQFIGMLYAALHNPDIKRDKATLEKVVAYSAIGLSYAFADQLGAEVFMAKENEEIIVFVKSSEKEGSAMRIDKYFDKWLKSHDWNFPEAIMQARIIEGDLEINSKIKEN